MVRAGRERDAEVAREAILEAAEEVFAREGFDGARIDVIAAESGYNKSLIFHYFGDNEGLYWTIIAHLKTRMTTTYLEPLKSLVENNEDINASLVRLFLDMSVKRYFLFLTQNPRTLRIMAWEAAEGWQTFLNRSTNEIAVHKEAVLCLSNFLHKAQDAGIINPKINPRFLLLSIANMCIMHLINLPRYQCFFGEETDTPEEALVYARQQIVELILHGILNTTQEGSTT